MGLRAASRWVLLLVNSSARGRCHPAGLSSCLAPHPSQEAVEMSQHLAGTPASPAAQVTVPCHEPFVQDPHTHSSPKVTKLNQI